MLWTDKAGRLTETHCEKIVFWVSDQVLTQSSSTATKDSSMLKILDLESRGIVLSV